MKNYAMTRIQHYVRSPHYSECLIPITDLLSDLKHPKGEFMTKMLNNNSFKHSYISKYFIASKKNNNKNNSHKIYHYFHRRWARMCLVQKQLHLDIEHVFE